MENLIELSDVTLTYPPTKSGLRSLFSRQIKNAPALKNISLVLPKGQSLALIGLNGSGKSSLLRVLAQIYHPNQGTVKVNGRTAALFNLGIGMRVDMSGRARLTLRNARMQDRVPCMHACIYMRLHIPVYILKSICICI